MKITETYANGITRTYETVVCATCATDCDPLAMFPGGICLECYKDTPAARRPITAQELARVWGAR